MPTQANQFISEILSNRSVTDKGKLAENMTTQTAEKDLESVFDSSICTQSEIIVGPSRSVVVRIPLRTKLISDFDYLIQPSRCALERYNLLSCCSVISATSNFVPFNLINLSSNTVIIPKSAQIGKLSAVREYSAYSATPSVSVPKLSRSEKLDEVLRDLKFLDFEQLPG